MRKTPADLRRRRTRETESPSARRHSTRPLALFTVALVAAAGGLAWAATRGGVGAAPSRLAAAENVAMTVYKSPTCGCCGKWVKHMQAAGFAVTVVDRPDVATVRAEKGVPPDLIACHTTTVRTEGAEYVVEGHVPAADIVRLLKERPAVVGIAVPRMPAGSPGMEGGIRTPFDVVSFDAIGSRAVYASH